MVQQKSPSFKPPGTATKLRTTADQTKEKIKILYYGTPGGGKTTDLASLANLGKTIHIDAEAGVKPTALRKRGIDLSNIETFPQGDESICYTDLDALFWEIKGRLDDDPDALAGVMWDSVTETQKLMMEIEVAKAVAKTRRKGMEREDFDTYREDWGVVTEQLRRLIRHFRDLPCHVGFAGLERRDQDDNGRVSYGVALTPALQTDLQGYVDITCHVEPEPVPDWGDHDEMFLGRFRAGGKFEVKDRFDMLPTRLVDPTMERVIQYVNGELDADTDPRQIEAMEALAALEEEPKTAPKPAAKAPAKRTGPRRTVR